MQTLRSAGQALFRQNRFRDLLVLARFAYRIGQPILSDRVEQIIEDKLPESDELRTRSYDDDPIPRDLIQEFDIDVHSVKFGTTSKYATELAEDKSLSIQALRDYNSAYEWFKSIVLMGAKTLILSAKANGWNTKSLYKADNSLSLFTLCLSRGRHAVDCFDFTDKAKLVVPHVSAQNKDFTLYAEGIVDYDMYDKIPREDGSVFTSPRMCAGSMLRKESYDLNWYKYLHLYAFNADGVADTISETLSILESQGFDVVPHYTVSTSDIPLNTLEDFCAWLKPNMDKIWSMSLKKKIQTDGLVVDVDDKNFIGTISGHYSSRNTALKFEHWTDEYYTGIVKNIIIEQKAVNASFVIEIHPMQTADNVKARRITGYSLHQLIANNVKIGEVVHFKRDSGAINILVSAEEVKNSAGRVIFYERKNNNKPR